MTAPLRTSWILTGLSIWLGGLPVLAGGSVSGFGADRPVVLGDLQVHLSDNEGYSEEWNHNVYPKDGGFIAVDVGITNLAMTSDHDGFFRAKYRDPDGKLTKCRGELDDDQWKVSRKGYGLEFGKVHVRGDLKGFSVKVRCDNLQMDLQFENRVPPYKPGGGILRFGVDDGHYGVVFTSPRARVTGTVQAGDRTIRVADPGHAMHSHYDMRPDNQVRRWFRFKVVDPEISLVMAEAEAPAEYGSDRNGWVLVLPDQGPVLKTARVNFSYDGFIQDTSSEEGYRIPRRVRIVATDGEVHLTGVLLMKKIKKVVDFTEKLGAVKRAVVRRFTKPRDYHIECSYQFRIKQGEAERTVKGDGVFRFFYVNP